MSGLADVCTQFNYNNEMTEEIHNPHIAIIGAGWYGCHLAYVLKEMGAVVTIYEKNNRIFDGASGKNSFRLHYGFHYPRNAKTRSQIIKSYHKFINRYKSLCTSIDKNLYAIAKIGSIIDFKTYCQIMSSSNCDFEIQNPFKHGLKNVEGVLSTPDEQVLYVDTPRIFFMNKLRNNIKLNTTVTKIESMQNEVKVNNETFDWCLNCTYNQFSPIKSLEVYYEQCLSLIYKYKHPMKQTTSITIMDGNIGVSLYPFIKNEETHVKNGAEYYTLTSVKHTPMHKTKNINDLKQFSIDDIKKRIPKFENTIETFYPQFKRDFVFVGYFISVKTKPTDSNSTAGRECLIEQDNRIIHVLSGKINTIIEAEEKILKIIGNGEMNMEGRFINSVYKEK